jgi:hypothetical protein
VVFNSLTFLVFFACVLLLHSMPFNWTTKKVNLLIASYLFYAAWNPPFVVLLWVSTLVDWYAAQRLVHAERPAVRRAWMLLSALANLGLLAYFKYGAFLLQSFSTVVAGIGVVYKFLQLASLGAAAAVLTSSETKRQVGLLRVQQTGVILSDYATLMVEILKDNSRPEAGAVYSALDMPWAMLGHQIAHADGK